MESREKEAYNEHRHGRSSVADQAPLKTRGSRVVSVNRENIFIHSRHGRQQSSQGRSIPKDALSEVSSGPASRDKSSKIPNHAVKEDTVSFEGTCCPV